MMTSWLCLEREAAPTWLIYLLVKVIFDETLLVDVHDDVDVVIPWNEAFVART